MTRTEALKALDTALWRARAAATPTSILHIQVGHAIDALGQLKTALAQPEQEPMAWMNDSTPSGIFARHTEGAKNFGCTIPLYTIPPQRTWVGLTDEEINTAASVQSWKPFAKAIEAKLKEKNT